MMNFLMILFVLFFGGGIVIAGIFACLYFFDD